jgi:hypothetical protein
VDIVRLRPPAERRMRKERPLWTLPERF